MEKEELEMKFCEKFDVLNEDRWDDSFALSSLMVENLENKIKEVEEKVKDGFDEEYVRDLVEFALKLGGGLGALHMISHYEAEKREGRPIEFEYGYCSETINTAAKLLEIEEDQ